MLIAKQAPFAMPIKNDFLNPFSEKECKTKILDYLEEFILHAPYRKKQNGEIGLRKSSVLNYINFKLHIKNFQDHIRYHELTFMDLNRNLVENFTEWLLKERRYSENHAGRILMTLKTLALDAKKNELPTHNYVNHISGFSQRGDKKIINILSFEDLKKIEKVALDKKHLENVRNWLIIGFWIGQRVSDLLTITPDQLRDAPNGGVYVDILQKKTDKKVTIGVIDPLAMEILRNNFPRKLTAQRFNCYLKLVLQKAGITKMVRGSKFNKKTKRKELGIYPKYSVICSHDLRRSFATNFFGKIPTPILMTMTGHSKESTFMGYIGRDPNRDNYADAFMEGVMKLNSVK